MSLTLTHFIAAFGDLAGQGAVHDVASRHIRPSDFRAIEVDDHAIVVEDFEINRRPCAWISHIELVAEVSGDIGSGAAGVGAQGCAADSAVAQRGRTAGPTVVTEAGATPGGALINTIIDVLPGGALGDQHRFCGRSGECEA